MGTSRPLRSAESRLFITKGPAGPANAPVYIGCGRANQAVVAGGARTPVYCPDPNAYDSFKIVDTIRGLPALPTIALENRMGFELSLFRELVERGCEFSVHVHAGTCKDPSDFDQGYSVGLILEGAYGTQWTGGPLGALDDSQNATVLEQMPVAGKRLYDIKPLYAEESAKAEITDEVLDIAICGGADCGNCGDVTDGCEHIFALQKTGTGSPGLPMEVVYTSDGGITWGSTNVSTAGLASNAYHIFCAGPFLVVVDQTGNAVHYAKITDILNGLSVWAKTQFAGGNVFAGFSLGRTATWVVGAGGYIYFLADPTQAPVVLNAGIVTVQSLLDINGIDENNLVAVGASNTVLVTNNGGMTWSAITGPSVGVQLNTVYMKDKLTWFIGDQGGHLWYTTNGGVTWHEKTFPQSGAGFIKQVSFVSDSVGYMAYNWNGGGAVNYGRILRTINGGYSWVPVPEDLAGGTMPTAAVFDSVVGCEWNANVAWAGGLRTAGSVDGILVQMAAIGVLP